MNTPHYVRRCAWMVGLVCAVLMTSGCASYQKPFTTEPAHPGLRADNESAVHNLPEPEDKVVVAVYRFRDQTGQYKPSETVSSFSTAVTQGATSILLRALEESGWFVTIEREGLSNLLNERQIIQSIRAQHEGPNGEQLGPPPPLLYAGVMLEGGIVGYDTNVITGGGGVRFFGIGGSGEFRQDQVTVYLRAVSTQSGRILKTVHTTKTIISQKVDGGAFLFIDQDRLLETEAGYSFNEPNVLAVTEAIQEAVHNLIVEGIRDGLWSPDQGSTGQLQLKQLMAQHEAKQSAAGRRDYFDRLLQPEARSGFSLGVRGGGQRYQGDFQDPQARAVGTAHVRYHVAPRWAVGVAASAGKLAAERAFDNLSVSADATLNYYVLPENRLSPFLEIGAGVRMQEQPGPAPGQASGNDLFPQVGGRAGLDYLVAPNLGLDLSFGTHYALDDDLDGASVGRIYDSIWSLKIGLSFYTGP